MAPVANSAAVDLATAVKAFVRATEETKDVVVESDAFIDSMYLAIASRTHIYVAGGGGVGKTFGAEVAGNHFGVETLYVQFRNDTKREEVFGPLSMRALQDDRYVHVTKGYLPEAVLANLDEFKDAGRFTRQLLNVLNERWFVNGGVRIKVPLVTAIGTTNFWIEEQELEALFDRFAQRIVQEPVKTSRGFKKILKGQLKRDTGAQPNLTVVTAEQLAAIHHAVDFCRVDASIVDAVDKLRKAAELEKLYMSPRRWGEGLKIARANAVLAGRDYVSEDDLRTYTNVLPNHPDDFGTARDLCKAFRDKFTEAVETARESLREIEAIFQPQRDIIAANGNTDANLLLSIRGNTKALKQKVAEWKVEHTSRDLDPFLRVEAELATIDAALQKEFFG